MKISYINILLVNFTIAFDRHLDQERQRTARSSKPLCSKDSGKEVPMFVKTNLQHPRFVTRTFFTEYSYQVWHRRRPAFYAGPALVLDRAFSIFEVQNQSFLCTAAWNVTHASCTGQFQYFCFQILIILVNSQINVSPFTYWRRTWSWTGFLEKISVNSQQKNPRQPSTNHFFSVNKKFFAALRAAEACGYLSVFIDLNIIALTLPR